VERGADPSEFETESAWEQRSEVAHHSGFAAESASQTVDAEPAAADDANAFAAESSARGVDAANKASAFGAEKMPAGQEQGDAAQPVPDELNSMNTAITGLGQYNTFKTDTIRESEWVDELQTENDDLKRQLRALRKELAVERGADPSEFETESAWEQRSEVAHHSGFAAESASQTVDAEPAAADDANAFAAESSARGVDAANKASAFGAERTSAGQQQGDAAQPAPDELELETDTMAVIDVPISSKMEESELKEDGGAALRAKVAELEQQLAAEKKAHEQTKAMMTNIAHRHSEADADDLKVAEDSDDSFESERTPLLESRKRRESQLLRDDDQSQCVCFGVGLF